MFTISKAFFILALLFAIVQTASAQGTKNPPSDNWQPPQDPGDFGKGTITLQGANSNCGLNNTEYQCFKSDFPISVTNKSRKLIIECDEADLCSMKFNFAQKGNFAKFTVNCLSYIGRQTPAHVNVKLFGRKAVLPIGIVYGSYKTVGEGIEAHWNRTSGNVKRFTDVSIGIGTQ